jgi:hypothetical protein
MDTPSREVATPRSNSPVKSFAAWLALLGVALIGAGFIYALVSFGHLGTGRLTDVTLAHFPAVVGLPFAALASLCVVLFLDSHVGAMEFEALGFKFRGASGPTVLWAFCFLAIAVAIKLLW